MKNFLCFSTLLLSTSVIFSQDVTPPVITCPQTITINNDVGQCGAIVNFTASATDDSQSSGPTGNLLLNGDAELNNLSHWVISDGSGSGWGWVVTDDPHNGTYSFIGSFLMGSMVQTVDLISSGFTSADLDNSPDVQVSEWYKASNCCSGSDNYYYIAELLNASMDVIGSFNLGSSESPVQSTPTWQQVSHTFSNYPSGLRYIRITHGSSDNEVWQGNYGTVIDDSEVRIISGSVSITYSQNPGTLFNLDATTVVVTATDASGNSSNCEFNVIVTDNTPPVPNVSNLPNIEALCSVTVPEAPTATDECSGTITATTTTLFPITQNGTTSIVWSYDDGNGNISTQIQNIIITGVDVSVTVQDIATLTAVNTDANSYQWIDCADNSAISGATLQTYIAPTNGSYAVIIETDDNCVDTSECVTVSSLGLEQKNQVNVVVSPNPGRGIFMISSDSKIDDFMIFDAQGRNVSEQVSFEDGILNTKSLESNVYFIQLKMDKSVIRKEIILLI